MTRAKSTIAARLTIRRGLSEAEAALYVGLGSTKFRFLIAEGLMPEPRIIGGRRLWDVDDLDAAFRSFPLEGSDKLGQQEENPWH
ncbi:hypothetical protein FHS85_004969 [Rhodoligotrophos appendicifer]|uniref:helix-turn-helix transcriptional regulator n=1 Tax=Rhodoligotrophos appendicifer TaxID=987056 RepID=UPI0011859439|nr:hypothetical protein [Rhodoligotrophos appendicifer]